MLILLQHNVAHLGIATGLCLSEAAAIHLNRFTPSLYWVRLCWHLYLLRWPKFWAEALP